LEQIASILLGFIFGFVELILMGVGGVGDVFGGHAGSWMG
jgi:hypothetical protein